MPEWMFDRKALRHTPSSRDGIDNDTENRYRKEAARFINDVGAILNLKHDTVATGCVYFHRFFMHHSFKDFNRWVAALGCLFLAGKVEETPKKCRDMIRAGRQRLTDEQLAAFGEDPREELMTLERVLLQTIKFDLQLDHPYQYLLKYAKILKGDQDGIQKMVQMAWTFINDSFCTTLCLQWEPEVIAVALIYLASRLSKFNIDDWQGRPANKPSAKWWDQFVEDITMELLEDICHQVLDLYSATKDNDRKKPSLDQRGYPQAASDPSTPSPGGSGKTPTATGSTVTTPNVNAPVSASAMKMPGYTQPPLPSTIPTPQVSVQHTFSVPPPAPPSVGQQMPSYAYAVPLPPQPPSGRFPPPPMAYAAGPGSIYAYNSNVPPPAVGGAGPPMAPAYAVPASYGPQGQVDYRAGPPGVQPTYGVPSTIPHAYNVTVPPPIPGVPMNHPPMTFRGPPPPPPHNQHHATHHSHRRM